MHIVLADEIDAPFIESLENDGHRCQTVQVLPTQGLDELIEDADVLVVRSTNVTRSAIEASARLGLIVRAGAGTDTIDTQAASENGIYVCNVPGQNAAAVAELTIGLLLAVDRNIPASTADLHRGRWEKAEYSVARGLKGRSMAILGLGEIGVAVAERATAFGIKVRALKRPERTSGLLDRIDPLNIDFFDEVSELLDGADIISLHLPLTDRTRNIVNDQFLDQVAPGAILLNTARGGLIDEAALLKAMETKALRVGLDVYEDEPPTPEADWDSLFVKHPNIVATHHIGGSTQQAREAVASGVVRVIKAYAEGHMLNCVNLADRPLGACTLTVRHRDEVGALAAVLACLRGAGINVQQMQNEIFAGVSPTAAVATIRSSRPPTTQTVAELRKLESVLRVEIAEQA